MILRFWRFPLWWYKDAPSRFPYVFKNVILIWEDVMAIRLMARFFFAPLFHDVTFIGRTMSLIYRFGRIVFGLFSLLFLTFGLIIFFALWLVFPIYLLLQGGMGLIILLASAFVFSLLAGEGPRKKISERENVGFEEVATLPLKNILKGKKTTYSFLKSLSQEASFQKLMIKIGLQKETFLSAVEKNKDQLQSIHDSVDLRPLTLQKGSLLSSYNLHLGHLFLALLDNDKSLEDFFKKIDLDKGQIEETIAWCEDEERMAHPPLLWDPDYQVSSFAGVNRTLEGTVTPSLNPYIRDLTAEAKRGVLPPLIERKELTDQVAMILARAGENNVVLVGEVGCGKTYLVYSLAQKIISGEAPTPLRFKRVVELDYTVFLGGTSGEGEILKRIKTVIEEIEYSGNIILFLDEIQNLILDEGQANVVYNALEPHLSSARFQVITAASPQNYHAALERSGGFANLFQKVEVSEASKEETLAILKKVALGFEKRQKVIVSFPALLASIELSKQYIHDRVLPEKAVSILDEAAVLATTHSINRIVGKEEVAKVISLKTKVPVGQITTQERKKLLNLEKVLHQRMVDQEEAVVAVANALRRTRAGLHEQGKPVASFLFVGPTGVGKTELARTLAQAYFGSEETMVRLDMSEFQNRESIASLIGPPLGQKGAELGGRLTEAIRRRPFCLLLLDEMEKAHPDILNLFLQVMDEARLTDSAGRTVDFSNTIIIATSNAGTRLIQEEIEKQTGMEEIKKKTTEFLRTVFKPEFLNRFDGIIVFKPLSPQDIEQVANLLIKRLTANLTQKGISVEVAPQLLQRLVKEGYDPIFGARPLRRLIQDKLEAKIAEEILGEKLKRGSKLLLDESILA